ncbi:MAG: copper amine oxidase N-terminal domain-containing protein [Oscillospiraceae bacterium]|nr:copper amine oxidase N-terminal domain-containing protein [Oscillospiraceae bacterium]
MKKRICTLLLAAVFALAAVPALCVRAANVNDYPNILFSNFNTDTVKNEPEYYPDFTVGDQDVLVQAISTYHWNNGSGKAPGTVSIYDWDDNLIGAWKATGRSASGANNVYWDVFPNTQLKAGTRYYIVDSDPDTWSYNSKSDNTGFAEVRGVTAASGSQPAGDPSAISVVVHGKTVQWTDAAPFIDENSRTMVPLRAVAEAMDLTVSWDGNTREATFSDGYIPSLSFRIGSSTARTSQGSTISMDTAPVILNDRTYAPIRYLAQYYGYQVTWDGNTKTVYLD